jgi:hypothetical protein
MAEERRTDKQGQRYVEFRGLSTHYVAGEDIVVSFRYPASFQPHSEDRVKLYVRGSRDKSIAGALVGDASKHRLCDGGLYRTGSVAVPTAAVRGAPRRSYLVLYGSGRLRRVVGKSEPFIICPQEDFPSIQIRRAEDSVFIEKLRSHSPIGSPGPEDLSFTAVSGGVSGGWEVLEEEEEDSWSDVGEDSSSESSTEGRKSEESSGGGSEPETGEEVGAHPRAVPKLRQEGSEGSDGEGQPSASPPEGNQKEGILVLKNANKELRVKVRVLHSKLHTVSQERDRLLASVDDLRGQAVQLKNDKEELKRRNKKLSGAKSTLKAKNKQLQKENAVLVEHCEKQVVQMSQYEAKLKALSHHMQEPHCLPEKLRPALESSQQQQKAHSPRKRVDAVGSKRQRGDEPGKAGAAIQPKPVIDVYVRDTRKSKERSEQHCSKPRPPRTVSGAGAADAAVCPHPGGGGGGLSAGSEARGRDSLSEQHIQSIMEQLKGGAHSFQCPVCMKVLHSHETEFSAQLHVEHCLLNT